MKNGRLQIDSYGHKAWYLNGKRHRLDGPAIIWNDGSKSWFVHGKRHRLDGPAIIRADGTKDWLVNGIQYTEEEFNNMVFTKMKKFFSVRKVHLKLIHTVINVGF